ncbi:MAG: NAD(P)/FAD-dependent oxidoreductase [Ndongobacter sp.]|nr:NAD(P)/FAD-dependent oxidoreductase [Ndongobacter sp.]
MKKMKRVAVIGMGASGCMAAVSAAEHGASVELFERNEKIGKKIYITGKGRCNVTNATPMPEFLDGIVRNRKFLLSAFHAFSNQDLIEFLEREGLPLKTERGARVFPASDHASDVNKTLERALIRRGVVLHYHGRVSEIVRSGARFFLRFTQGGRTDEFDCVIVCCGGLSYPLTGSTGDGYRFAEAFGHTVQPCTPSLVAFKLKEEWIAEWEGLSLKNVALRVRCGKSMTQEIGELLFTRDGISGPLVLSASARISGREEEVQCVEIDWKPGMSDDALAAKIRRFREEGPNRQLKTLLESMLPKRAVQRMSCCASLPLLQPLHQLTKEQLNRLCHILKHFPLTLHRLGGFNEAVVTRGGVCVKEVQPSTMESKYEKGLFFAGELLDVDGFTGGYNLQIAFSTGWLAGRSAAQEEEIDG